MLTKFLKIQFLQQKNKSKSLIDEEKHKKILPMKLFHLTIVYRIYTELCESDGEHAHSIFKCETTIVQHQPPTV